MKSEKLNEAIALIRAGRNDNARHILFEFIRDEPENEVAWVWLAETLTSNPDRMKIYNACLLINPESKIAKMAIKRLNSIMQDEIPAETVENPFSEDGTFDPGARERTGHTGALIGVDGSFILTNVVDFDEVIDLRTLDDETLNQRLVSSLNSDINIADRKSDAVKISNNKKLESGPDLASLVDEKTFSADRYSDRDHEVHHAAAGHQESDDFSSILDERIFNDTDKKDPSEDNTTPLKSAKDVTGLENESDLVIAGSLAEKFLRDDGTGELTSPDKTFEYNFFDERDIELDFEPDLTSFLEKENIKVEPSKSLSGSFGLHQDEINEEFDFEDIPHQDELSLDELGFSEKTDLEKTLWSDRQPLVVPPVEVVKKELSEEFEFNDSAQEISEKKKRKRKFMYIGAAVLILVTGLSLVTVFAFPEVLPAGQKRTPTPTIIAPTQIPTATTEKIVLPPVVTDSQNTLVESTTDTPTPTSTETTVVINNAVNIRCHPVRQLPRLVLPPEHH